MCGGMSVAAATIEKGRGAQPRTLLAYSAGCPAELPGQILIPHGAE